ncbi:MAG: Nif3-like dinuclear metal center hexameric protein [Planctomycetaceae bacterium]|nr:Nif3-like dinuclear metal center hexameric protein [Planctomycetaceae bacterium]
MQVTDVLRILDQLAPPRLAESWDNVGLLWGDAAAKCERVMTCLTLTPNVGAEAIAEKVDLIVSHHPILFKPTQRIVGSTIEGRMLLQLAAAGVSVHSPHTAWDNAVGGINQQLAELLELEDIQPLRRTGMTARKVAVFVPHDSLEAVQEAAWQAGAGGIGEYHRCSYYHPGTGTFQGSEKSNPTIGEPGQFERVEEDRVEFLCESHCLADVLSAIRKAHPYEEPAIDVYPLEQVIQSHEGSGRYGTLAQPMTLVELANRLKPLLRVESVATVGAADLVIKRLAIACGAAAEFQRDARKAGCQALLTGEARFHACLEARDSNLGLLLPGHYATERLGLERLAELLKERLPELTIWASHKEADPLTIR